MSWRVYVAYCIEIRIHFFCAYSFLRDPHYSFVDNQNVSFRLSHESFSPSVAFERIKAERDEQTETRIAIARTDCLLRSRFSAKVLYLIVFICSRATADLRDILLAAQKEGRVQNV
jgi:hypothetical protein